MPERAPAAPTDSHPLVGVLMGSKSDYEIMQHCGKTLDELGVPFEARVLSAHRTPDEAAAYSADAATRGLMVIIAAAGGAAHLAGVMASKTLLPVLGVPMPSQHLNGMDSLLSTVQMPAGVPVGTLAIGKAGAINAAILAAQIIATSRSGVMDRLRVFRAARREDVLRQVIP
jgi:5-(carboxyamino)imidazole ribonucleotide mutase